MGAASGGGFLGVELLMGAAWVSWSEACWWRAEQQAGNWGVEEGGFGVASL